MENPTIKIVNSETGEEIIRDMNKDELKQFKIESEAQAKRFADEEAKASAKEALLDRLGITAEEAALLLG